MSYPTRYLLSGIVPALGILLVGMPIVFPGQLAANMSWAVGTVLFWWLACVGINALLQVGPFIPERSARRE